jgi:hypothetical protein
MIKIAINTVISSGKDVKRGEIIDERNSREILNLSAI